MLKETLLVHRFSSGIIMVGMRNRNGNVIKSIPP